MIISCEKCGTRFRLKDDAVKPEGIRVRCSLCRHIFTVHSEGPGETRDPGKVEAEKARPEPRTERAASARLVVTDTDDFDDFLSDIDDNFLEDDFIGSQKRKQPRAEYAGKKDPGGGGLPSDFMGISSERKERRPSFLRRMLWAFFLVLLAVAVAGGAALYLYPELVYEHIPIARLKPAVEVPDAGASRLVLAGVAGSFVDSSTAGSLFVIRGSVRNEYPESRSFIQVQGSILDDKGKLVLKRTAYAGNAMSDEDLDGMSAEDIARAMNNSYGIDGINRNVPAGTSVPFAVIFESLPENVAEFTVESLRSLPGTS